MDREFVSLLIVIGLVVLQFMAGKKKKRRQEARRLIKEEADTFDYSENPFESLLSSLEKDFMPEQDTLLSVIAEDDTGKAINSTRDFVEEDYFEKEYASKELFNGLNLESGSIMNEIGSCAQYEEPVFATEKEMDKGINVTHNKENTSFDPKLFIIYSEIANPKYIN